MASNIRIPSIQELIAAYTSSNQTPDTYKIGEGAVRGQELSDSVLNNSLNQRSKELDIRKEIENLKNQRNQKKKEQAYAETLKQGPVVASPGGQPVHAAETIQGLSPEDQTLADIAQPYTKDVAGEQLKEIIQSKSEQGKLERAKLRQDQQNSSPDRIKQLFQLEDGRTVGVTYGGNIQEIHVPNGAKLNPLEKTLPAEQVEKTGTFQAMTDLVGRIRQDITDQKTGKLSETGKKYLGPLDTAKQVGASFTPAADVGFTNFHQKLQDLKNQIIYLRSGKQINEQEYKRLRASLPSEYRDESTFLSNLDNFEQTFKDVMAQRQTAFKEAGYKTPQIGNGASKIDINALGAALGLPKKK